MPTVDFNINKQIYYIISWEYSVQDISVSMKKTKLYLCIYTSKHCLSVIIISKSKVLNIEIIK